MNHSFNTAIAKDYSWEEAVILENIYFWCKKNEANGKLTNGEPWTYNTVKAFNIIFDYLSPSVISRALKRLEENGLVKVGCFNKDSHNRTKWYCITDKTKEYYEPKVTKTDSQNCEMENSEMRNGIRKDEKSISQNCEMLYTDINTDNKPNINSDTSSPQPAESSNKDSLPQEEISKSHYEQSCESQSNTFVNQDLNSKSHCGSATGEKETSEFKQVKDLYLKNYNTLVEQKVITAQEFSQKQWQSFGATINQNIAKYGLESVLKILTNSFDDDFCRRSGYILTTIFHTNIAPRLLVAPNYYPNSFNKQSSSPRSYQQPRQFDENHLIF